MMPLMADDEQQFRFLMPAPLMESVKEVFDRQGIGMKEGSNRLFGWFVEQPPELQAAVLGQLHGESAPDILRMVLRRAMNARGARKGK